MPRHGFWRWRWLSSASLAQLRRGHTWHVAANPLHRTCRQRPIMAVTLRWSATTASIIVGSCKGRGQQSESRQCSGCLECPPAGEVQRRHTAAQLLPNTVHRLGITQPSEPEPPLLACSAWAAMLQVSRRRRWVGAGPHSSLGALGAARHALWTRRRQRACMGAGQYARRGRNKGSSERRRAHTGRPSALRPPCWRGAAGSGCSAALQAAQ